MRAEKRRFFHVEGDPSVVNATMQKCKMGKKFIRHAKESSRENISAFGHGTINEFGI